VAYRLGKENLVGEEEKGKKGGLGRVRSLLEKEKKDRLTFFVWD